MKAVLVAMLVLPLLTATSLAGDWSTVVECKWSKEKTFALKVERQCEQICVITGTYNDTEYCYELCNVQAVITEEHTDTMEDQMLPIEYLRDEGFFYPGAKTNEYVIRGLDGSREYFSGSDYPNGQPIGYTLRKVGDSEIELLARKSNGTYTEKSKKYTFRGCKW